jgi:hypothetical protein
MTTAEQWARAFTIFSQYTPSGDVSAEHDEVHAGPDPEVVSDADKAELASLHWHVSEEYNCFKTFA